MLKMPYIHYIELKVMNKLSRKSLDWHPLFDLSHPETATFSCSALKAASAAQFVYSVETSNGKLSTDATFLSNEVNIFFTLDSEKCMWIVRTGQWYDQVCEYAKPYACEFPSFIGWLFIILSGMELVTHINIIWWTNITWFKRWTMPLFFVLFLFHK